MKKSGRFAISLLLLIILSTSGMVTVNASDSIEPKVYIENGELPVAKVGNEFTLVLALANKSKYLAKEIKVTPQIDESWLELSDLVDYQLVDRLISTKNEEVTFKFRVKETAKTGVYPLTFDISYKDASNRVYSSNDARSRTIYIKIIDGESVPEIIVKNVLVSPEHPKAGQDVEYDLEIVNLGERPASDVTFSLEELSPENFTINNGINKLHIRTLDGGESTTLSYALSVNEEMKTGVYALKYKIAFKDQFGSEYASESEFYTSILAKDDEIDGDNPAPKIILSSYKTSPGIVMAGGIFNLDASFYNTSKTTSVRNIKVTMSMKESDDDADDDKPIIFTPVNSTNVVYIDQLQTNQSSDCSIAFNVAKSAEAKTYIMVLKMEYEDRNGNQYEAEEEIYIRVSQVPNLGIDNINYRGEVGLNEDSWFSAYIYNNSGVEIYNLLVKIEGENIEPAKSAYYVGSIKKYNSEGFDTTIRATVEGKLTGFVTFTYEDAAGKQYEQKKQFDITSTNYYDYFRPDEEEEEPEPSFAPLLKKVLTWAAVLLAVIITVVILLKRRKKLKNRAIEEQLINEIMNKQ